MLAAEVLRVLGNAVGSRPMIRPGSSVHEEAVLETLLEKPHVTTAMTEHYSHVDADEKREAAAGLLRLVQGGKGAA